MKTCLSSAPLVEQMVRSYPNHQTSSAVQLRKNSRFEHVLPLGILDAPPSAQQSACRLAPRRRAPTCRIHRLPHSSRKSHCTLPRGLMARRHGMGHPLHPRSRSSSNLARERHRRPRVHRRGLAGSSSPTARPGPGRDWADSMRWLADEGRRLLICLGIKGFP